VRIDVHAHYYPEQLLDMMEQLGHEFISGARGAASFGGGQFVTCVEESGLPPGAINAILDENAQRLLGLFD
jgi:hypothetical protein